MNLFDLTGKNAVIVGGAGGIGQALAQGLAEAGANVAISSRKEEGLKTAQAEIKAASGKDVSYYTVDAVDEASVEALVANASKDMGKIDIMLCAQGLNQKHNAEEFPMDAFRQMMDVNIVGFMMCAKHFGKHMIANGYGKMILLSSVRGKIATKGPGNAGYCATKGAVDMLTKQLASEFGPHGITVNAIGPNITATPMMVKIFEKRAADEGVDVDTYLKQQGSGLPMRRMANPDDCVGAAVFLAAPASDFLTGNILYPDGGLTAIG